MKSKMNIKSIIMMAAVGIISLFFINMSLAANTAKIKVETANLRETADENSKILDQFSMNEEVEIIEKQGDWYKVKIKGITGYLRQDLITIENQEQNTNQTETSNNAQTQTNETQTAEQQVAQTTEQATQATTGAQTEIKIGNYKISENTKLKIVPVINATDTIEVKKDEEVKVTEILNDWVCVETQNTKGWIRKEKIQVPQAQEAVQTSTPAEATIKTVYVNSQTVNLRKEANTTSEIITKLSINTAVEVTSEENGWSKVKVSGQEGYISTSLLSDKKQETSRGTSQSRKAQTTKTDAKTNTNTTTNAASTTTTTSNAAPAVSGKGSSVVATAKKYIGCKYVYGGTTPSGFDCSGFTSYIYKQYGVNLNRTAAGQYSNGKAVARNQLQPGDLVMFGKSGINHVGIYIGGGSIVHAANKSSGVRIDSINSGYYNKNYVGARRVI